MAVIDRMARIYGTRLWYPIVLNVYGGFHSPSLAELVSRVSQNVQSAKGRVLDIACGPGTFGRRIATPSKEVFGIDISGRMLRQGAAYAAKEGTPNVHFARAGVEALPFEGDLFDAALCCGSLHLFADTVIALREMARVMKPAATLSVFTFVAGRGGVLKFRRVREWRIDFQNRQRPMFRISRGDDGFDADSIDQAREGVRSLPPGRYRVDKIRADPFPSGHTSRAWGHLIRDFDGSVVDEPHRWPERTSIG